MRGPIDPCREGGSALTPQGLQKGVTDCDKHAHRKAVERQSQEGPAGSLAQWLPEFINQMQYIHNPVRKTNSSSALVVGAEEATAANQWVEIRGASLPPLHMSQFKSQRSVRGSE